MRNQKRVMHDIKQKHIQLHTAEADLGFKHYAESSSDSTRTQLIYWVGIHYMYLVNF